MYDMSNATSTQLSTPFIELYEEEIEVEIEEYDGPVAEQLSTPFIELYEEEIEVEIEESDKQIPAKLSTPLSSFMKKR